MLRDTIGMTDTEYLRLIELAKIWWWMTYHSGGICRKSDLEDWLTRNCDLTRAAGHGIANHLEQTYNPRTWRPSCAAPEWYPE